MALPGHANVVIVGGGIAGCSIAYHLTRIGITDVVLLERKQLTCGTTWHAAGLVGQLRATRNLTELAKYTADLYHSLEAETGQATGFKQNGSISVAPRPRPDSRNCSAARRWARPSACASTNSRPARSRNAGRCSKSATWSAASCCPRTARPTRSTRHRRSPRAPSSAARRSSRTPRSTASASRRVAPSASRPNRATSQPTPWCSAPACGRTAWRPTSTWPCRCTPRSTSTSSPSPSRACPATCPCCGCRTNAPTTRKTRASC